MSYEITSCSSESYDSMKGFYCKVAPYFQAKKSLISHLLFHDQQTKSNKKTGPVTWDVRTREWL